MPNEIDALMGLIPAEDTAGQSAVANALRGQQQMGDFYSLSPTLGDYGRNKAKTALSSAEAVGDRRQEGLVHSRNAAKDEQARKEFNKTHGLNVGKQEWAVNKAQNEAAATVSAADLKNTNAVTASALDNTNEIAAAALEETNEIEANRVAHERALELQRLKNKGTAKGTPMGTTEKKNYRIATTATSALPAIISQVEANPEAFGATKDINSYLPGFTPNVLTESVKNLQKDAQTDEQQMARNAVYEQAYQIIHELAGAALSAHEKQRIEAFTPAPNDNARTVANKLRSAMEAANRQHTSFDMYSDYEPLPVVEAEVVAADEDTVESLDARIAALQAEIAAEEAQ
jgi:hypothetical protein